MDHADDTSVTVGASGAVFGIYGLLLATLSWSVVSRPAVPFALITITRIAAAAVPFLLYNLVTGHLGTASEMAGLGTGFVGGLLVARGVDREKPRVRRAAMVMAATMLIAVGAAWPLRGIIDFRPEIVGIVAVEERTAGAYDAAADKFKRGRLPAKALAQLIDRTIIPDLQAVRARLEGGYAACLLNRRRLRPRCRPTWRWSCRTTSPRRGPPSVATSRKS